MKLVIAAVTLCLGSVSALGQGPGGERPRPVLKVLDTDGDGKLSAAEIAAAPKSLLKLDRNGDGQITPDELSPTPETTGASADDLVKQLMDYDKSGKGYLVPSDLPERQRAMFTRGDSNQDGKLTPEEIRALARKQGMPAGSEEAVKRTAAQWKSDPLLAALDANHDGVISAEEIANAAQELMTLDVNHDGEISADEMRVKQASPEERVQRFLAEWDTNGDGKLSKAELPDRMQQNFETLDKNGDGFLDKNELLDYFKTANFGRGASSSRGGEGQHGESGEHKPQATQEQK